MSENSTFRLKNHDYRYHYENIRIVVDEDGVRYVERLDGKAVYSGDYPLLLDKERGERIE